MDDDAVEVKSPEGADTDSAAEDAIPSDSTGSDDATGDGAETDDGIEAAGADEAEGGDGSKIDTGDAGSDGSAADEVTDVDDQDGDAESLADRVAGHDESLADDVEALESELADARRDANTAQETAEELRSKLARVRADFSNYKQRAKRKREEIRERASEDLVERIVPVRNDLLRALDQESGSDIRPGVESTVEKFDDILAEEGVMPIEPSPGTEVDPARHQVMLRVESDRPAGTIDEVYEPGYEMGDRVIVEARVTVSSDEE